MRILAVFMTVMLLAACSPAEKEVLTTSVDVDESGLPALMKDLDALTDNALPVAKIIELAATTPMDDELQERYSFVFDGADEEVQIHVWREQADWVHLYFSTTSKDLVAALEQAAAPYARQ